MVLLRQDDYNTVDMSQQTLRDIYFPPFKAYGCWNWNIHDFNEIMAFLQAEILFCFESFEMNGTFPDLLLRLCIINEMVPHGFAADGSGRRSTQCGR